MKIVLLLLFFNECSFLKYKVFFCCVLLCRLLLQLHFKVLIHRKRRAILYSIAVLTHCCVLTRNKNCKLIKKYSLFTFLLYCSESSVANTVFNWFLNVTRCETMTDCIQSRQDGSMIQQYRFAEDIILRKNIFARINE